MRAPFEVEQNERGRKRSEKKSANAMKAQQAFGEEQETEMMIIGIWGGLILLINSAVSVISS